MKYEDLMSLTAEDFNKIRRGLQCRASHLNRQAELERERGSESMSVIFRSLQRDYEALLDKIGRDSSPAG